MMAQFARTSRLEMEKMTEFLTSSAGIQRIRIHSSSPWPNKHIGNFNLALRAHDKKCHVLRGWSCCW